PGNDDLSQRPWRFWPWIAGACAATTLLFGLLYLRRPGEEPRTLTLQILAKEKSTIAFDIPAISPNSLHLTFVASTDRKRQLWSRNLGSLDSARWSGTDGAYRPFWSPDSHTIAFFAGGCLKRIDADGGPATVIVCEGEGLGGTWNQEGTIVFNPGVG